MPGSWLVRSSGTGLPDTGAPATRQDGEDPARAVLLGLDADESGSGGLDELERLAETDGVAVVGRITQPRDEPDPATYLGAGEVDRLADLVRDRDAGMVIADGELSPAQTRNLEERVGARVVDRVALILDIFAQHARSSEGKAQVELAQLAYQLPRLRGQGTGARASGEQRLESQLRHLRRRMALLRRQVADIGRRRQRTRFGRRRSRVPSVALTGYTNAGKSALLNRLTGADVPVGDALFATVDPTLRRTRLPDDRTVTVTDTVGLVRHLPHELVDAFRPTLEEVVDAGLVVHVVDASAPDAAAQVETVRGVLTEIGARDHPELLALNKVDVAPPECVAALRRAHPGAVPVSARTGEGLDELRAAMAARLPRG
ncbi:GTPase HflX [Modestobacter marinus]|uniref:GTPase HflX n=1 Tax=Modestobacter marinus TaxID=477641 RepID=UPI001C937B4C|nr:GTPase HflX [Modestobacter marinus]